MWVYRGRVFQAEGIACAKVLGAGVCMACWRKQEAYVAGRKVRG